MKQTILVIEDTAEINDLLKQSIEKDGYGCVQAFSGSEARLLLEKVQVDLILLDLMLPGVSGEILLQEIKKMKEVPVIVISAKNAIDTRVEMLEWGADDYICKPFDLAEVLARIHVQLRKLGKPQQEHSLCVGGMRLDLATYQLFINNKEVPLTKHEFRILQLLMQASHQVFTKQAIYEYAWEEDYLGDERIINTHIGNLRAKFRKVSDEEFIQTVWGIGFKMVTQNNL